MHFFSIIILVGLGGFAGSLFRYFLFQFSKFLFPNVNFPLATLCVNVLGSFLLGFLFSLFSLFSNGGKITTDLKLFLVTGFLGGLTTFSTYTWDSFELLKRQEYFYFFSYFLLNNGLSLLALVGGYYLIKQG